MRWNQELHRANGTTVVELTWADVMFGSGLADLERQLTDLGIVFAWNPGREIKGSQPVKHETLVGLVRTFMTHVKSNSLTSEDLDRRLGGERRSLAGCRTRLFLNVY
jgi:DNA helicase-4